MMPTILARDPVPEPAPLPQPVPAEETMPPDEDFEIVLGKRQLASVLFLATVILAVFSALSYIAGEALSPRKVVRVEAPPAPAPPPPVPAPVLQATILPPPKAAAIAPPLPKPAIADPMFADPHDGEIYLQMGVVDKGIAVIIAEGLRQHQLRAFVAPGPNDGLFRS